MIEPRRPAGGWLAHLALAAVALATLAPLLLMLANAFTPNALVIRQPIRLWPSQPTLANFVIAGQRYPLWTWLLNSLFGAAAITLGKLLLSVPAGFAFGRLKFRGRDAAFAVIVATLSFPSVVAIVPTFMAVLRLGLSDTRTALIVPSIPYIGFYVFYLRQAFRGLPASMFEAAMLDGAGLFRQLISIALPNVLPQIAVTSILAFVGAWNIYLWAQLVLEDVPMKTLVTGIALFADIDSRERLWGPVMACAVLSVAPVLALFMFAQRFLGAALMPGRADR
jgi:ABC-type glycerol-3-phosphate transport system permease component